MRFLLTFLLAGALGACASLKHSRMMVALDPLLHFSDTSQCIQSDDHGRLLSYMVAGDANGGFRAGKITVPESFRQSFGTISVEQMDNYTVIGVKTSGTMFGLPLVSIRQILPEGGDPGSAIYTFDASIAQLGHELQARGFPAKAGPTVSMGLPDGYDHFIHLLEDPANPARAMFECGYQ